MRKNSRSDSGFTLLELLVVMAIGGILSALSVSNYIAYKQRAYNTIAKELISAESTALAAGRIGLDDTDSTGYFSAWTNMPGPVRGWRSENFVPGLVNAKNVQLYVYYDESCERGVYGGSCSIEGGSVRHCKGNKMTWWWKLKDGTMETYEFDAPWGC